MIVELDSSTDSIDKNWRCDRFKHEEGI